MCRHGQSPLNAAFEIVAAVALQCVFCRNHVLIEQRRMDKWLCEYSLVFLCPKQGNLDALFIVLR